MIQKLKTKLLLVILSILILVFMIFVGSINIVNYQSSRTQARSFLQAMSDTDGVRPPRPESGAAPDQIPFPHRPEDNTVFHLMNFYGIRLDEAGQIIEYVNENNLYTKENIKALTKKVLDTEKSFGTMENQYYLVAEKPYGILILFMDNSVGASNAGRLQRTSLIISGISLIFLFFVSFALTHWMLKPVQEAFQKQKQFISDASHELKTPLSVIGTNAEVLEREIGENKWLHYIKTESVRMNKMVNELLTLAKLDTEEIKPEFVKFDLGNAMMSVLLPFESHAFEENIAFQFSIAEHCMIFGNEDELKQLTAILTENAFKYCNQNGRVQIELKQNGHKIYFSVYNSGQWIQEEEKQKIFERFYRSDKSRNRKNGSYGLGLAIAKAIVYNHKGSIAVDSSREYGTKFIVVLYK